MPKKLQHIDTLNERHFNWLKWSLTAASTVLTAVFIQLLHAGTL